MKKLLYFLMIGLLAFSITACDDDDEMPPEVPNEEEVITTLNWTLTNINDANDIVVLSFVDLDGDGGNAPVVSDPNILTTGATYTATVEFLNELEMPAEDITEEIKEEDDEHQVFYQVEAGLDVMIDYDATDLTDDNGNPVGIVSRVVAGAAGTGKVTVTLRHEPVKNADNVKDGDITNASGETDIEVAFDIEIQ